LFGVSDGKFLLVQEFANSGFWLPGGGVDAGENLAKAATRETLEEAGISVRLTGVLRVEHSPSKHGKRPYVRLRVIYYGEPVDEKQLPKSIPDYESVGAVWVAASEVSSLPLRGSEPKEWIDYLMAGGAIYPLSILTAEGDHALPVPPTTTRALQPLQPSAHPTTAATVAAAAATATSAAANALPNSKK